ncbi:MAG: RNA polymerase sigma factor RpoE [Gammaproteobacteria bacterium]|nr:RNA polymerase sigma factor RpoE [Gammaproteobacteria bacterium]MXW08000.1 RNA polymerase sigma factor RpoE [Gammaproteobacteria bacterium]MYC24855.1 RNA polymerase sigma factor RpoE [Gammaproteobacteria bacterium]
MTVKEDTDAVLVKRVQAGDNRAFDLLFHRYKHRLRSAVSRILDNREDVDDVVQDAFVKAYRALPKFRGESQFFTWLYRIATNTAKNHLVAKARKHTSTDVDIYEEAASNEYTHLQENENPENLLESRELELLIKETVQNLEPELRSAITLREHAGLSYEQIAQIMDCPVGTVRSRIFRARASVSEKIRARENRF